MKIGIVLSNFSPFALAINTGKTIEGYSRADFSGNPVTGKPDLGAFESGER